MSVPTARSRAERRVNVVELRFEAATASTMKFYRIFTCEGSEAAITQWGRVGTSGEQYSVVSVSSLPERLTDKTLKGYARFGSTSVVVDADMWTHATGGNGAINKRAFETIATAATEQMFPESEDEHKTRLMRAAQEFIAALEPIARGEWPS